MHVQSNESEENGFNKLSEVAFSSALSLFLTYLGKVYIVPNDEESLKTKEIFLLFTLAILIYCILYFVIRKTYSFVFEKIRDYKYKKQCHYSDLSPNKIKELIDDFDNITFDHLIICYEFIDEMRTEASKELVTYYFHETIYYLRTAINKTKELTYEERRNKCLNVYRNTQGVDVFRLVNAQKIMLELYKKIEDIYYEKSSILVQKYSPELNKHVLFQLNEIKRDIDILGERCESAIEDIDKENEGAKE
jgi:hypothetical protein